MNWEFDILYFLQGIHNTVLNKIMVIVSTMGNAGLFWIILACILLISKQTRKCGIQMIVAMLIALIIGNGIIKNSVQRMRPCWIDESVKLLIKNPKDFSFPSGHSLNGIVAAVTIYCNNKKYGIIAIIFALIIAFSRLYNFVHFPTDVLCGLLLGTIIAIMTNEYFETSKKNPFKKLY
ncbi:phosphatase PAP2 family protein [Lachnobacterium bovis]|uniref:Undecaprenyl-diphosphatase n=2 Tax=Lachnobacterium bovis TaxID=140626 RepID=A0A1H9RFK7_9FIRM|nr:phosphatase PAP2 family protein [Lachnobacterium bovis]SER70729.1 undecaprenyl-diphosphatase [Lachnobacterium bovis]